MVAAILVASLVLTQSLDNEDFSLRLPNGVRAMKHPVNFETDSYDVIEPGSSVPLMTIIVGGGAYDLRGFHSVCLNGRRAWRREGELSPSVVFGYLE
jgi:hypothetical protein